MPRILLTNDDGYHAAGIQLLARSLAPLGTVCLVAPDRERSGVGRALTLQRPVRMVERDPGRHSADGTPTDCVHLGYFEVMDQQVDLVVAGVNHGINVGEDVAYSGTANAAMEGAVLGVASIAVSTLPASERDLERAAGVGARIAAWALAGGLAPGQALNVNVPPQAPHGLRWTRQARRGRRSGVSARVDPSGRDYFWLRERRPEWADDPESDQAAVAAGYVSLTPLRGHLTDDEARSDLASELVDLELGG